MENFTIIYTKIGFNESYIKALKACGLIFFVAILFAQYILFFLVGVSLFEKEELLFIVIIIGVVAFFFIFIIIQFGGNKIEAGILKFQKVQLTIELENKNMEIDICNITNVQQNVYGDSINNWKITTSEEEFNIQFKYSIERFRVEKLFREHNIIIED